MTTATNSTDHTLWDVCEEHLDDAVFYWEQWELALSSANQTTLELSQGLEETLHAHLDALVVGAEPVAERLLLPIVADDSQEAALISVATWVLLRSEQADHTSAVLEAVRSCKSLSRLSALLRGIELTGRTSLWKALERLLVSDSVIQRIGIVQLAKAWNRASLGLLQGSLGESAANDPPLRLTQAGDSTSDAGQASTRGPASEYQALRAVALDSVRVENGHNLLHAIEQSFASDDTAVFGAAIQAGLLARSPHVWRACREAVQRQHSASRLCLSVLAFRGESQDWKLLEHVASSDSLRSDAVWAAGYWGSPQAAELCVALLADETVSPVAADSLRLITGVDLEAEFEAPAMPDEEPSLDDEADLPVLRPEDDLPTPNVEALSRWWDSRRSALSSGRQILGRPATLNSLRLALEECSMWRRPIFANELEARHGAYLNTRTWSSEQARMLQQLEFYADGDALLPPLI